MQELIVERQRESKAPYRLEVRRGARAHQAHKNILTIPLVWFEILRNPVKDLQRKC